MDMEEKLIWLDQEYLSKFDVAEIDSRIAYQEPFTKMKEVEMPYSVASEEPLEDNTFLSYNKVIGTSLEDVYKRQRRVCSKYVRQLLGVDSAGSGNRACIDY